MEETTEKSVSQPIIYVLVYDCTNSAEFGQPSSIFFSYEAASLVPPNQTNSNTVSPHLLKFSYEKQKWGEGYIAVFMRTELWVTLRYKDNSILGMRYTLN